MARAQFDYKSGHWPDYPRQQINHVTSWLDASHIYGISKSWSDILRSGVDGKLKTEEDSDDGWPKKNTWGVPLAGNVVPTTLEYPNEKDQYLFGDTRSFENPAILSLHWLFFREHNRQAEQLKNSNKKKGTLKTDKWLFDKARFMNIAKIQKVYTEAVEEFLDWDLPPYTDENQLSGYLPAVKPDISILYAGALQFFHLTMVPDQFVEYVIQENDNTCVKLRSERLCNWYWNAQEMLEAESPQAVLTGLLSAPAMEIDDSFVPDIQSYYWGPMKWTRRDAVALAIQRGRDLGVPPLNTVLTYYMQSPMTWSDWERIIGSEKTKDLQEMYGSADDIELLVGGFLLHKQDPGKMPRVFQNILYEQFMSTRHGDRFWYENQVNGMGLSEEELNEIEETTMKTILQNNGVFLRDVDEPFKYNSTATKCDKPTLNTAVCKGKILLSYNYNTTPYAIPILLPSFLVITVIMVIVMRYQAKLTLNPPVKKSGKYEPFGVVTELQSKDGDRVVDVVMNTDNGSIVLLSRGKKVRTFKPGGITVIKCTDNKKDILIVIPKEYDIYLRFGNKAAAEIFVDRLENFALELDISYPSQSLPTKRIISADKLSLAISAH
eukprot:sb/3463162/